MLLHAVKFAERDVELSLEVGDPLKLNLRLGAEFPDGFNQIGERFRCDPWLSACASFTPFAPFTSFAVLPPLPAKPTWTVCHFRALRLFRHRSPSAIVSMPSRASKHPKRPRDTDQLAWQIVQEASGQGPVRPEEPDLRNPAAVALSKLAASKGGRAQAKALFKARREETARKAAKARWRS